MQNAVEVYLRERLVDEAVWFGLTQARVVGEWEHRGGNPLGAFTFWKGTSGTDPAKLFACEWGNLHTEGEGGGLPVVGP